MTAPRTTHVSRLSRYSIDSRKGAELRLEWPAENGEGLSRPGHRCFSPDCLLRARLSALYLLALPSEQSDG